MMRSCRPSLLCILPLLLAPGATMSVPDAPAVEHEVSEAARNNFAIELDVSYSNITTAMVEEEEEDADLLVEEDPPGRQLAEAQKPKRKFCNTSAYSLKGDYAYEACGTFCKQAKAANHCKFCKCKACTFCPVSAASTAAPEAAAAPSAPVSSASGSARKGKKAGMGMKGAKGKGKGAALKKKLKEKKAAKRKLREA